MALASYSDLTSSIADWLNRDDLTNVIPDFVKLAETQLNREIRHYKMHNKATANIDSILCNSYRLVTKHSFSS